MDNIKHIFVTLGHIFDVNEPKKHTHPTCDKIQKEWNYWGCSNCKIKTQAVIGQTTILNENYCNKFCKSISNEYIACIIQHELREKLKK